MMYNGSYSVREKYIYKKFQQSYLENEMVVIQERWASLGPYRFAMQEYKYIISNLTVLSI